MNSVVQYILNQSKLEVTLIRITNATADGYKMTINSRVTGTGPVGATMKPMVVDMCFQGACFGKLELPEVQTSASGADINIYDQDIKVTDMVAFRAFVKSLMNDEDLVLTLDNGACSIRTFGLTANCTYKKEVFLKGMNGPKTELQATDATTNTVIIHNPSPLEIEHGVSMFEIHDSAGAVLAELKGQMEIKRGDFVLTMHITRQGGKPGDIKATLVGMGTENPAWTNDTLKYIKTPLQLTESFCSLY
ncbi:hypothetical protein GQ53DRAFT_691754 [Thozetella sp. PMI_491]|nr:hypothetical protein GQ53DRAFT_691754 [Thozetella sp. PMI_491]